MEVGWPCEFCSLYSTKVINTGERDTTRIGMRDQQREVVPESENLSKPNGFQ